MRIAEYKPNQFVFIKQPSGSLRSHGNTAFMVGEPYTQQGSNAIRFVDAFIYPTMIVRPLPLQRAIPIAAPVNSEAWVEKAIAFYLDRENSQHSQQQAS